MSQTADLGWCMARCEIEADKDAELTICEPASSGSAAQSITLVGLDAIVALRDLIDETIANAEQSADLSREKTD